MSTIRPDQLASEIEKTLDEFKDVTEEAVSVAIVQTANKAVAELQSTIPAGAEKYGSWSKYLADWERTPLSKAHGKKGFSSIIHNRKHYQLAHLLEKGHAIKSGGRTVGNARAFEHIAPVAERVEGELMDNIKKHIQ